MSKMGSVFLLIQEMYYDDCSTEQIVSCACAEFGVPESFVLSVLKDVENAA